MGLFDELEIDVASAVDPFAIPLGMHLCFLTAAEMKKSSKGGAGLAITYTIDGGDHNGTKISEWKNCPANKEEAATEDGKKSLGWLKQRLTSLGVPEDRMNTMDPDDLVGIHCWVTVKEGKDGFTNIGKVSVADENASAIAAGTSNPFA